MDWNIASAFEEADQRERALAVETPRQLRANSGLAVNARPTCLASTAHSIQVGIRTWVDDPLGIASLDNVACDDLSIKEIADLDIVGCDVVEVSPPYDVAGITALNAATVVYEQLCRVARGKGAIDRKYAEMGSCLIRQSPL